MKPIVLFHGYSAESQQTDRDSIRGIYGTLAEDLKGLFSDSEVIEIDLSRYISLDDSVSIYDVARALDRVLKLEHPSLLQDGFHAIIHSTGALVIRNWLMMFSAKPSPLRNLVYLAGANFGSGWASIGQGQLARWGRYVFEQGAQRGVKILQALELGSSQTLDMHLHFLKPGNRMQEDYEVQEFVVIGTQADPEWYEFPLRYAKEDGADGVVRASATNLNFNYVKIGPVVTARDMSWENVQAAVSLVQDKKSFLAYYEIKEASFPSADRKEVPFAIVYECAHSGKNMGIVSGDKPKEQVHGLIIRALRTPERSMDDWQAMIDVFNKETKATYDKARIMQNPGMLNFLTEPREQYDPHAQVIFRITDQDGLPVNAPDIFLVSEQCRSGTIPMQQLFEDTVRNNLTENVITFYLRVQTFNEKFNDWEYQLDKVRDFSLEITAVDVATSPASPRVSYLPLRMPVAPDQLKRFIQPHRTTLFDIQLVRMPSPDVYRMVKY